MSLDKAPIDTDTITVFASGNSIEDLSAEDIQYIKDRSFLITVNYAPIKIVGHMNIHSDKRVTEFLHKHFQEHKKQMLVLTRERAFNPRGALEKEFKECYVDYWFNEQKEKIKGNYTIVWLLQLLEKYYSNKKVLIFGLDMTYTDASKAKWYDHHTSADLAVRGPRYPVDRKLSQCTDQLTKFLNNKEMFINCNPNSGCSVFNKVSEWRTLL